MAINIPIRGAVLVVPIVCEPLKPTVNRSVGNWVVYGSDPTATTMSFQRYTVTANTGDSRSTTLALTATTPTNAAYYSTKSATTSIAITQTGVPPISWTFTASTAFIANNCQYASIYFPNSNGDQTMIILATGSGSGMMMAAGLYGTVYANASSSLYWSGEHTFSLTSNADGLTFYIQTSEFVVQGGTLNSMGYGITLVGPTSQQVSKQGTLYSLSSGIQVEVTTAELKQIASTGGTITINVTFTFYGY